jgi:hypothetical protein
MLHRNISQVRHHEKKWQKEMLLSFLGDPEALWIDLRIPTSKIPPCSSNELDSEALLLIFALSPFENNVSTYTLLYPLQIYPPESMLFLLTLNLNLLPLAIPITYISSYHGHPSKPCIPRTFCFLHRHTLFRSALPGLS